MSSHSSMPAREAVPSADHAPSLPQPSIADPGPLGLAGFAMTTFVLSVFNANLLNQGLLTVVLPLALFYGGIGQLLAGMWEFRKGNTFGALAFTSYGAFWLAYYWFIHVIAAGLQPAGEVHKAVGLFLLVWTIFTAYMTIAAMRTNGAVLAVFVALTLAFLFLTIGAFASTDPSKSGMTHIGGWLGLITAALAWYASFAGVANSTFGKVLMPTWPLAATAIPRARAAAIAD
ncbi:MAG: acetate uptake transporter [Acidothermaceae bacterium]